MDEQLAEEVEVALILGALRQLLEEDPENERLRLAIRLLEQSDGDA